LVDIYPTINDLCGLPTEPNTDGNGYPLEGHSFRPLLSNPDGKWTGPDVTITALPGKDHSQHNRHQGTWFPHFSVRSEQYRYTLCANGEEEFYDYEADPLEWENLANDPAHAETKAMLKKKLIELRDGPKWTTLNSLKQWARGAHKGGAKEVGDELYFSGGKSFYLATIERFQDFELQFELKSTEADRLRISYHAVIDDNSISGMSAAIPPAPSNLEGGPVKFEVGDWNQYRIRVLGDRCRVWINEQLHSDVREENRSQTGVIAIDFPGVAAPSLQIRQSRIRPL
jgi:hypothetical protein